MSNAKTVCLQLLRRYGSLSTCKEVVWSCGRWWGHGWMTHSGLQDYYRIHSVVLTHLPCQVYLPLFKMLENCFRDAKKSK